jgi:hypothetical protein
MRQSAASPQQSLWKLEPTVHTQRREQAFFRDQHSFWGSNAEVIVRWNWGEYSPDNLPHG